jgi:hypothetical protein
MRIVGHTLRHHECTTTQVYTTSESILGSKKPAFLRPQGPIYQLLGAHARMCGCCLVVCAVTAAQTDGHAGNTTAAWGTEGFAGSTLHAPQCALLWRARACVHACAACAPADGPNLRAANRETAPLYNQVRGAGDSLRSARVRARCSRTQDREQRGLLHTHTHTHEHRDASQTAVHAANDAR